MSRVIYGFHAVKQHIKSQPQSCQSLMCLPSKNNRLLDVINTAKKNNIRIKQKNADQLDALAGNNKHQGCVLEINETVQQGLSFTQLLENIDETSLLLVLDNVQDPHNLGACLRTSDATGVQAVIIPTDNSADITPVVSKVAAGGAETVPLIKVTNLSRALKELKQAGVWLVGTTDKTDQSLYETNYKGAIGLVMGAEGKGMRRLTTENCDELIKIPMLGQVESLNVSVATGVCLYEINRQRHLIN